MERKEAELQAIALREDIIRMIGQAGSGHPGGSLSCIDILCALYFGGILRNDPAAPKDPARDYFILAKGHAAPALYATLAHRGFFPREELMTLRRPDSRLQGHPDCRLLPGVEVSTGSLGQGLSIACGIAAGLRLDGKPNNVVALLGDGECEEGQVWEAAMFAAHNGLDNLVAIIDNNGLQIDGPITQVCSPENIAEKFRAFGWNVCEIDGHDYDALLTTVKAVCEDRSGKPYALVAKTVKGKGVSFMENRVDWHGVAPNAEQVAAALAELEAAREVIIHG